MNRSLRTLILATALLFSAFGANADERYTRNVAVVVWNGIEVLDLAGPSEVFESASRFGRSGRGLAFNVYTVGSTKKPVTIQRFIDIVPNYDVTDAPPADIIVLAGGGTGAILNDPSLMSWVTEQSRQSEVVLTVCTGALVAAKIGLLDDLDVTTWYGAIDRLAAAAPSARVHDGMRFVDNGHVVTTAGISAGIDGSLHVVARLLGRSVAERTAAYMEYPWSPPSYLAKSYKYLNPSLTADEREVQRADQLLREGEFADAAASYRAAALRNPDDDVVWFRLGQALMSLRRDDDAIEAFVHSASSDDQFSIKIPSLVFLARLEARNHRSDAAFSYLDRAVSSGLTDATVLNDDELSSLKDDPRFAQIADRMQ